MIYDKQTHTPNLLQSQKAPKDIMVEEDHGNTRFFSKQGTCKGEKLNNLMISSTSYMTSDISTMDS